jgi:hypothetical protein
MIPGYVRKQAQTVAWRLDWMERTYGVDRLMAVHPTTVELWEWPRLTRQWNNLWTKRLSRHYADYLLVPEYSPEGRLHAHVVVVARRDIRSGYDFEARERAKKRGAKARWRTGANCALRTEMKRWNAGKFDHDTGHWMGDGVQLPYGFGYTRIEPVKSPGGFARYMAKYMTKGFAHRRPEDKGRRLIRCSQRVAKIKAPRIGVGVALWDAKLASFLALNELPDADSLRSKVGKGWAWYLKEIIWGTPLHEYHDIEWDDLGGKHVIVFGTRVAYRDGVALPYGWDGSGTVTCRYNSAVKRARFKDWDYVYEQHPSEDLNWESDGTRRFVPEGPQVSEWGPERNRLILRDDLRRAGASSLAEGTGCGLVQVSLGLDDPIRLRATKAERRRELWRKILKSIEENPF